jgi:spermidine synthase
MACAAAASSGMVALVYEVAWTRLLVLVIGPTTYAFTTVVASFVVGIALGSAVTSRLVRRTSQPLVWLGVMLVVTALGASAAGWFAASRLPLMVAAQVTAPDAAFGRVVVRQAFAIAILLLPMTCALGAAFPFALGAASAGEGTVARDTARVYAWNTFGAIAGSVVGGFALLPLVGLHNTFRLAAIAGLATALVVWTLELRRQPPARRSVAIAAALLAVGVASTVLLPSWDLSLLASGAYKYAPYLEVADLETDLRTWRQAYYKDGAAATVSVRELAGMRSLVIDGKADASNMGDMLTQRLLGLLPVLLHPDPEEICVIGLGSGVTVGSALARGTVQRADVVEISPEVVRASRFFERENRHALDAPGVHLIVGDGRSHLLLTRRRYDVIVSEPSNPWMAGIAALFTKEFFEAARARLKPDGLVCQWAHTYDMSDADLRSIVQTFTSVFPQTTMWLVGQGDLLLIGTNGQAIEPGLDGLTTRWREGTAAALLDDVAITGSATPFALFSLLAGGPDELRRYGAGAAIQRDDLMALEFSAPRAIYGRPTAENASTIRQLAEPGAGMAAARRAFAQATDVSWAVAGAMELKADGYEVAYDRFRRAVLLNASNADALSGLTDAATGAHRLEEARGWLQARAAANPQNAPIRVELSRLLALTGNLEAAAAAASEAVRAAPDDPRPGEQLASIYADAGEGDRLLSLADALIARFPSRDKPRYYRANALLLHGRHAEAAGELRQLVGRNPRDVRAQSLLGVACATGGARDCALAAFTAALAAEPRDTATYVNLGVFHLQSGDPASAASSFAIALTLDRSSAPAAQGMTEARAALSARR